MFQAKSERNYSLCSQNSNIENTFRKLSTVQAQYSNIINQLPKGQFYYIFIYKRQ